VWVRQTRIETGSEDRCTGRSTQGLLDVGVRTNPCRYMDSERPVAVNRSRTRQQLVARMMQSVSPELLHAPCHAYVAVV